MKHIISGGNLFFVQSNFAKKMKSCRAVIRRTFIGGYEVYHFNVDYYIAYKLYANTHVVPLFSNKDMPRFE